MKKSLAVILFIFSFFCLNAFAALDYKDNVSIVNSSIEIDHDQLPAVAYLLLELKNNGDRKVSNATFEVKYYEEGDYLIRKAIVKKALNDSIPPGESRKYKIRLQGTVVNIESAQYPYDQSENIDRFEVKILNVQM